MRKFIFVLSTFAILATFGMKGQEKVAHDNVTKHNIALKTNLLYDATTTLNAGLEVALAKRWSLDISGNYNPWTFSDNMKWKHWLVQPELRYWFCEKLGGNFLGLHLLGGQFNVGNIQTDLKFLGTDFSPLGRYRFQGWTAGAGLAYGYAWMLGKHWNLEAEVGVGYTYSIYDKFQCVRCGSKLEKNRQHNYVGPTKAALNLVYVF